MEKNYYYFGKLHFSRRIEFKVFVVFEISKSTFCCLVFFILCYTLDIINSKRLCQAADLQSMHILLEFVFCNTFGYKKSFNFFNQHATLELLHFYKIKNYPVNHFSLTFFLFVFSLHCSYFTLLYLSTLLSYIIQGLIGLCRLDWTYITSNHCHYLTQDLSFQTLSAHICELTLIIKSK